MTYGKGRGRKRRGATPNRHGHKWEFVGNATRRCIECGGRFELIDDRTWRTPDGAELSRLPKCPGKGGIFK